MTPTNAIWHHIGKFGLVLALAACSPSQQQEAATSLDKASTAITQADAAVDRAKTIWGIAKGIAMVAEIAQPASAPAITLFVSAVDARIAQMDQMRAIAVPDAQAIIAVAKGVQDSAVSLQNGTAGVVTVVANKG